MKNICIKICVWILFVIVSLDLAAQKNEFETLKIDRKYVAWVSPSKATHIYGLMFNVWPKDSLPFPKIYGGEFNISPIGFFAPFLVGLYSLDIPKTFHMADSMSCPINYDNFKKVYGFQLGFINFEQTIINGLDINASGSFESVTNGVTISAIRNNHFIMNGLTVAVVANNDCKCRGTQIALLNTCNDLMGFQFGLWNKNQNRSLPFINWAFKN